MSTQPTDNPTALLQQMHRWRMAFFGLIILLAGAVIGASVTLLVLKPKPPQPPEVPELFIGRTFSDLERNLNLSEGQTEQIHQIMRNRMEAMRRIRQEDMRSRVFDEMGQLKDDIGKVLTDEQMKLWQQRIQRFQREFWRGRGGPGGHVGPGGPGGRMGPGGPAGGRSPEDWQRFRGGQSGSPMRGPGGMDRRFGPGSRMPFGRGPNTVPEPNGVPGPNSASEPNLPPEPNTADIP